jgi:nicotinamidase-related amidase
LKKYNNYYIVEKYDCDGSKEICRFLLNNGDKLVFKTLKFGGVYTNECVADTVLGLLDYFNSIQLKIIESACGAASKERHEAGIERLKDFGVKIVKS